MRFDPVYMDQTICTRIEMFDYILEKIMLKLLPRGKMVNVQNTPSSTTAEG
jgi:hypothetical protein